MTLGHAFLMISLISLGFIGIFHKLGDYKNCRPSAINVGVFFWAAILTSLYVLLVGGPEVFRATPGVLVAVAGLCGMCASMAVLSFQSGLRYGKIATSWVIINLSAAVPTVLSLVIYKEALSLKKALALILILLSMFLLWKDKQIEERRASAVTEVPRR